MPQVDISTVFAALSPDQQEAFYLGPASIPPEGITPNFNSPNRNAEATGILILTAVIANLSIAIRLYPRLFPFRRMNLRLEDYAALAAWACFVPWVYFSWAFIHSAGIYTRDMTVYIIYLTIAMNTLYCIASTIIHILACSPRRRFWDRTTPGTCLKFHASAVAAGVVNVITDYGMLAIPQKIIWGLHLSRARKTGISSLFAIGIFACVCATARFVSSVKQFMDPTDITYNISPIGFWSCGEVASIFLVLGVPSVPRVVKKGQWMQRIMSTLRLWTSRETENSRKGLPSWYKRPVPGQRLSDRYTDIEEHELVETIQKPNGTISRETQVDIN
ncbi:hypothetical protein DM02DRAFT_634492 [Periconia macrospinosa]|uniref:Rhodopsin domain-containing protein n=1 Tax=Periconia macrospinosa TaxID=97972 RepID=A0A2V1D654_9PLEO|nr:hypothetical protein DM02DRAFT_634492 [Periconia macrospinosa]